MTETATSCDAALIELQSALELSLLHYVKQADLWVKPGANQARGDLDRLATEQQRNAGRIAGLLTERHLLPEASNFPSEFATLHYLSLTYVMTHVLKNQEQVVTIAEDAEQACCGSETHQIVQRVRESEVATLAELRSLLDSLRHS